MKQKSFDDVYDEYEEKVKEMSGGLVTTNKAEFLKLAAFNEVVNVEVLKEIHKNAVRAVKGK
ncbi:hypothetical protein [Mycobacteroides abscessus]|uniref:hypothetical protein n=1 Tax=Mycobacteroides abscessus TaxID=36809 RepID=UPI000C261D8B